MVSNYRMTALLLVVMMLALANWACCGTTSMPRDLSEAETTVPRDGSLESSPLPGEAASDPTATSLPSVPTVDVSGCTLGAVFEADVTIPDNTLIDAGQSFVKTWSIRNTGTCDWGPGYLFTFIDGNQMGGPQSMSVPETAAGEATEVSVELVAPTEGGTYRGNWQICVNRTECFGDKFYVQIVSRSIPIPPDSEALIDCLECAKAYPYLLYLRSEPGAGSGMTAGALRHADKVTVIDAFWHISESRWWYQVEGYDEYTERISEPVTGWLPEENVTVGTPEPYPLGVAWGEFSVGAEEGWDDINIWDRPNYYNGRGRRVGAIRHGARVEIIDREWEPENRIWFYQITGPEYETGEAITGWLDGIFLVLAPPP